MKAVKTASTKYVAYYRVSTQKQGRSGLGLEAQQSAVADLIRGGLLVEEFLEVESGKKNNREQLSAAIECAKRNGARLVIAKLDRLSRNAGFIFTLKDSGVDFICADMPDANTLTIGIFATLAQHERELISSRTKAALEAKKRRGVRLGNPGNLTKEAQQKGVEAIKRKAENNPHSRPATMLATTLRGMGHSLPQIAQKLNESGHFTPKGKLFSPVQVKRLLDRSAKLSA